MSSHVIQVSGDPEIPIWFEKMIFTPLFRAQVFARAAELKALSLSPSGVGARAQPRLKGVRNVFPNQSGISGFWRPGLHPTSCTETFHELLMVVSQLQKCFDTSPDLLSAWMVSW